MEWNKSKSNSKERKKKQKEKPNNKQAGKVATMLNYFMYNWAESKAPWLSLWMLNSVFMFFPSFVFFSSVFLFKS